MKGIELPALTEDPVNPIGLIDNLVRTLGRPDPSVTPLTFFCVTR